MKMFPFIIARPRLQSRFIRKSHPVRSLLLFALSASLASSAFAGGPSISVSASPSLITNQGDEAIFTIKASAPPKHDLVINFLMSGTTVFGRDYFLTAPNNASRIIIPAGQTSVDITMRTLEEDTDGVPTETAIMFIEAGPRYHVGHPLHASVTIQNLK